MDLTTTGAIPPDQSDEVIQAMLFQRSLRMSENQQLALIESARLTGPAQPLDSSLVGTLLNAKV